MLHDMANDGGYVALKRAAEDREGWRHRERMSKTCYTQKTTDDDFFIDIYYNIRILSIRSVLYVF